MEIPATAAVEVQNIRKTFGNLLAVNDLSLKIPEGSIYGLIGPNGSGKTTTMRMIMNILTPDQGDVQIFGNPPHPDLYDQIGYLPEERGLYRKMLIRELLIFYGSMKNGKNIPREVDYWLDRFGLTGWANKKVETLSKGMSQKVQFIASIVFKPGLLILDEPFSGLDPVNTEVLRKAILEMRDQGTTIIFSTHDMFMAENLCDYICMIYKGNKVLDGTLGSIREQYGQDTLVLETDEKSQVIENIHGVGKVRDLGQVKEIQLAENANPQRIVMQIMEQARVTRFELVSPSLHEIFIRIVEQN
jgi:ABC-2 type transport system ATP-binding protein